VELFIVVMAAPAHRQVSSMEPPELAAIIFRESVGYDKYLLHFLFSYWQLWVVEIVNHYPIIGAFRADICHPLNFHLILARAML
jgi:hypothetical protein